MRQGGSEEKERKGKKDEWMSEGEKKKRKLGEGMQ